MGDKYKSEIQKPVNNPLLSGAGHGFPFDTFQGSSLLVPVTQDNPSVLTDQVGEPDKFVGQVVSCSDGTRLNDPLKVGVESREDQTSATQPLTGNQRYTRLFNAFFGGSGKSEPENRPERSTVDQQSSGSVSSTPRSFSPYVHVPNFQTATPALQVPSTSDSFESVQSKPSLPIGPELGTGSLIKNPEGSEFSPSEPPSPSADRPSPFAQSRSDARDQSTGFTSGNAHIPGYQYQNIGGSHPHALQYSSGLHSNLNPGPQVPENSTTLPTYPAESGSSDATKPPLSTPNAPPLANPNAPPLFRDSSKTYRLSHNKRPVYAPIPGLTLSSSGTSSYLQTSDAPPPSYGNPVIPSTQPIAYSAPPTGFPQPLAYSASTITAPQRPLISASQTTYSGHSAPPSTSEPSVYTQPTSYSSPSTGLPSANFPPPSLQVPLPPAFSPPTTSQTAVVASEGPPMGSTQSIFKDSTMSSQSNIPSASSYFNLPSTTAMSSPMTLSMSNEAEQIQPLPESTQTKPILPYPSTPKSGEKQNLFAPISKANTHPPESNPVFNPVAIHPSGNLPPNLQPRTSKDENQTTTVIPPSFSNLAHVGRSGIAYRPPYHHWFYKKETDSKEYWFPFSMTDSVALEQAYQSTTLDENTVIPTDGGRYDVNIIRRMRMAVYWEEAPKEVRRCSWFYKNQNESRYRPYDENTGYHLEEEYKKCVTTDSWRKNIPLTAGEYVVLYSTTNMVHFENNIPMPDDWEGDFSDGSQPLPSPLRIVKRGISDDFDIDDGESPRVDHLVFVVHGIGSVCDLKFRTIEEAVDVFRSFSQKLSRAHFSNSMKQGLVNRIEILPISWHSHLHGETTGLDKRLAGITLKSIPRLRNFTNDTLLDILFYTSPVYCQNIVQQVGHEITNIYGKFKQRNPTFNGSVSLVGHSLGSLILFDMLCHQKQQNTSPEPPFENLRPQSRLTRRMRGFVIGNVEVQQPYIEYPQLPFQPVALFALGSPIGMFITVRGIDSLGKTFAFPTCPRFFNIFHPFDPVAYRIEPLIDPEMSNKRPVLIPHHKGRKRMHLELKETLSRVGNDLKQRLVDSIRSTWNTVYQLTTFGRADDGLEQEVDQVIEKQIAGSESAACLTELESTPCDVGCLNQGRRIDFVLQEAPLESFNEYVSAIRSHLIYWDSEDTILMILKEIYSAEGIAPDAESLVSQDSAGSSSPTAGAPGVGWNITEEPLQKTEENRQAPSYGFINE